MLFASKYGHFTDDGSAYIVTNPDTPRPWANILANPDYGAIISHTGGGYSWVFSSKISMLTRWNQDMVGDADGKLIYITEPARKKSWTINWNPCADAGGAFRCTHAVGHSILERTVDDLQARLTCFVPPRDPLEIWLVELTNRSRAARTVHVQSYLDWLCDQWPDAHREFHRTFLETAYAAKPRMILARKRKCDVPHIGQTSPWWPYTGFHAASLPPTYACGDRAAFLGRNRSLRDPRGLTAAHDKSAFGRYGDACASLRVAVTLAPRATTTVVFVLGAARSTAKAAGLVRRYCDVAAARAALAKTTQHWQTLLGGFTCATPDKRVDLLTNTWLKYQAITGRIFGKTGYYQNSGAFGFRDQLQDSQVWFPLAPARARPSEIVLWRAASRRLGRALVVSGDAHQAPHELFR